MTGTIEPPQREKVHLLVVEDEPIIRELFSTLLIAAGYSVSQAHDGFAALEEVRRQRPALILSDLNMPRMTGFELLSVVRRRFPGIHVIAMSGAFDGDEIPKGVAADAYYQKSGRKINTLVEVIEGIIQSAAPTHTSTPHIPADADPAQPEPQPHVALWVSKRGFDLDCPYILLSCPECLRSFPHCVGEERNMELEHTQCVYCKSPISYALLDPSITHHPGYAPATEPR